MIFNIQSDQLKFVNNKLLDYGPSIRQHIVVHSEAVALAASATTLLLNIQCADDARHILAVTYTTQASVRGSRSTQSIWY